MQHRQLGDTGIQVSALCLGTMTWGQQNTEAEAFEQLDAATAAGIDFIDTAEVYPVPVREDTRGRTEEILGNWLARRGRRDDLVIATKVAGPQSGAPHIPAERRRRLDRATITRALEGSLRRLRTDYVDLYQVHWPDRRANYFGRLGYEPADDSDAVPIEETLEALAELVRAGKVRHIGVSNETPWGVMRYLCAAERTGQPRLVSIQNPYSLLNRTYEVGLAEVSHRERVGLLAYSPLGFGVLSGKYLDGGRPEGARLTRWGDTFRRYFTEQGIAATAEYVALAREHGLDPAQMAIAFILTRPWVTSVIIGQTTREQLESNLAAAELELDAQLMDAIEAVHRRHPNPCP